MTACSVHDSGAIELYFYGELDAVERARVAGHVQGCAPCSEMLRELRMIREALAERPDISAPPSGDWSAFMGRLDAALRPDARPGQVVVFPPVTAAAARAVGVEAGASRPARRYAGLLATAALLAIVSASLFVASQAGRPAVVPAAEQPGPAQPSGAQAQVETPVREGLATVGMRHLERSKLVVLGLATKNVEASTASDWEYERELATGLLNDTRLYRLAAEQRGLSSLASVMKDLELVLLQASMAEGTDRRALPQIQRLIQKRGLVQKMDVVATTGLVP